VGTVTSEANSTTTLTYVKKGVVLVGGAKLVKPSVELVESVLPPVLSREAAGNPADRLRARNTMDGRSTAGKEPYQDEQDEEKTKESVEERNIARFIKHSTKGKEYGSTRTGRAKVECGNRLDRL